MDYCEPPMRTVSSPSLAALLNNKDGEKENLNNVQHTMQHDDGNNNKQLEQTSINNEIQLKTTNSCNDLRPCVDDNNSRSSSSSNNMNNMNMNKNRFGGLIWRTSKERRKCQRRDKCNSGDSGIQIELEQDEKVLHKLPTQNCSGVCAHVRRTNSMQYNAHKMKININSTLASDGQQLTSNTIPRRSISQPDGLEASDFIATYARDSDSDSVASHDDTTTTRSIKNKKLYAEVLYNFTAVGVQELSLERGKIVEILRRESGPWWLGRLKMDTTNNANTSYQLNETQQQHIGWFPREFVRVLSQEHRGSKNNSQEDLRLQDQESSISPNVNNITTIVVNDAAKSHVINLTNTLSLDGMDLLRQSAVKELLHTEVNYVKLLAAICEGYLPVMSKRVDIFTPTSVLLIFSNILEIYKFQQAFLEDLRKGVEQNQIAKIFLKYHKGFLCYSTYCNAYPRAVIELESYDRIKDAKTILDNCRELQNLAELPLSAHLLSPVQRICRYPLHLNEILKTSLQNDEQQQQENLSILTPSVLDSIEHKDICELDIPDVKETIEKALDTMKSITEAVNEGKRHSETIARHQSNFQNFKGPPLHLHSTRFFLQIDATRLKQNLWNSSYTLFLFDNQLIYCKRDIIKRSQFFYKGRIFLDRCRIVNIRDGKMFGNAVRNSLRIYCETRRQWYDFSFRSSNRKQQFLNTLALERQFIGGKTLQISEMTDYEWACSARDCQSDQSDCELTATNKDTLGIYGNTFYQAVNHISSSVNTSGESSGPESPAKSCTAIDNNNAKYSDTLPKKSQSRYACGNEENCHTELHTGSLRRRRLRNWFRKSKSTNNTPNQSPTHEAALPPMVPLK